MPVPNNSLRFVALDSTLARALRDGAADANGPVSERQVSDGGGNPSRHCLHAISPGAPLLVLAHPPFPAPHPPAHPGPIFLPAPPCPHHPAAPGVPAAFPPPT